VVRESPGLEEMDVGIDDWLSGGHGSNHNS